MSLEKAYFQKKGDSASRVDVHFNPVSLQYTINNQLKSDDASGGAGAQKAKQYVSQTTAKLEMELVFDTTASGADVRATTAKLQAYLQPSADANRVPPVVEFHWGVYSFGGMVESYKETIDFFATEGVPLRATVNLGLVNQDAESIFAGPATRDAPARPEPSLVSSPNGAAGLAAAGGAPGAARALASANGMASLRFSAGAEFAVGAAVELKAPAAFASGGAGFGLGMGASAGAGIGLGAGAALSAGIGVSASASAGVSASAGAFAGLRAGVSASAGSARLDVAALTRPAASVALPAAAGAEFSLGGSAGASAAAGLGADVGVGVSLNARLSFDC